MSVETPKNLDLIESTQEDLLQLKSQVIESSKDKEPQNKGGFEYLRKSNNKQYDIYKYKFTITPGLRLSKTAIINYLTEEMYKQFGWYPKGFQFTDDRGNEIKGQWFTKSFDIYLRIPHLQFHLVKNFSDREKRNWKVYGYTLEGGEDYEKLESIYHNMNEKIYTNLLPNRNFCDKNGNLIKNVKLKKGETVYIRIPDRDKVDSVPEMTMSDIEKLKEDQIKDIFASYQEYSGSDATPNKGSKYEHADKKGNYIMINGKKLYIQYPFSKNPRLLSGQPCILVSEMEGYVGEIFIGQYDGTNFNGVRYGYNNEGKKILERGEIKLGKEWFQ